MLSKNLTRGLALFDAPYYHLPVADQLKILAEKCPETRMDEIRKILAGLSDITIVTVEDYMLCVTHDGGASFTAFKLLTIVDELE